MEFLLNKATVLRIISDYMDENPDDGKFKNIPVTDCNCVKDHCATEDAGSSQGPCDSKCDDDIDFGEHDVFAELVDAFAPVIVHWTRFNKCDDGWYWEHVSNLDEPSLDECLTAGFLFYEDDDVLYIIQSYALGDQDNEMSKGRVVIPRNSVISVSRLRLT